MAEELGGLNWLIVDPPTGLSVTEQTVAIRNSAGLVTQVTVTCDVSQNALVSDYEMRYRLASAADYIVLPKVSVPQFILPDLAAATYIFEVRALNSRGATSEWVATQKIIWGLTSPPAAPQGLRADVMNGLVVLSWQRAPEPDVQIGGRCQVRFSPIDGGGPSWQLANRAMADLPGSAVQAVLPAQDGFYLIRFIDSEGYYSSEAAVIRVYPAQLDSFTALATVTEHERWAGVSDGTAYVPGGMQIAAGSLAGTYYFDEAISLAAAQAVRVAVDLYAIVFAPNEDVRLWPNVLTVKNVFGDADGEAWVEARFSNTAGAPVWSDWQRVSVGDFFARDIQFRLQLRAASVNDNVRVSRLSATASIKV